MVQLKIERRRLRRVDARGHAGQIFGAERAIGGVRADHRHIGHAVAELKAAHAIAELIDFPDDIIAHHERRPAEHRLRVEVAPDHDVGVLDAGGEHADPHLAPARPSAWERRPLPTRRDRRSA